MEPSNHKQIAIKLQDVTVKYGDNIIIDNQTLHIGEDETVAIIGESGQGKTTAIDVIRGHLTPTSGQVSFFGRPVQNDYRTQRTLWPHMPLVSQEDSAGKTIQSYMTAIDNVAFVLQLRGQKRKQAIVSARRLLEQVGLSPRMHDKPGKLSGGERQRVAVARALVTNSKVILADEPTAALDPSTSHDILKLLTDSERTIVMVTHDAMLAAQYVERILLLHEGVFHEVTETVLQNPASRAGRLDYGQLLPKERSQQKQNRNHKWNEINDFTASLFLRPKTNQKELSCK